MKKSQLELFGLAIVVVIVIISTLFLLAYFSSKKPSEARKGFVESELASGMINTLINIDFEYTDIDSTKNCARIKMAEIIRFCGSDAASYACNGKNSCDIARETITDIFSKTIDSWTGSIAAKKNYYFSVYTGDLSGLKIEIGEKCQGNKKFKEYIIPPNIHVNLEICG